MPLEILQSILRHIDRLIAFLIIRPFGLLRSKSSKGAGYHSYTQDVVPTASMRHLHDFQREVRTLFLEPCNIKYMQQMSKSLKQDYVRKLQHGTECMLPSFCHTLPTGQEMGAFIALDVGGSTFRVALVELSGRSSADGGMKIRHMTVNKINEEIRLLPARDFFAWMALKIQQMLQQCKDIEHLLHGQISIGLAWSFPIEQTSPRGGRIQPMGKGFKAHEGVLGDDLGHLIEVACQERGLDVRVNSILNDSSATLLAQAYVDSDTSMALILGTGTNAAVFLPVSSLGSDKFGLRDAAWFQVAEKVIINTEVSMFGNGILPKTRWDSALNMAHTMPDFQPLEYMTTGRYLGELLRLIIVEAIDACHLFGGVLPVSLQKPYTLDTALLAAIEEDMSIGFISSAERVQKEFALERSPLPEEMIFLRAVVESISQRAAAYMATALHALWLLQHKDDNGRPAATSIAANGSVILMYPGFRMRCEEYIAQLIALSHPQRLGQEHHSVVLKGTTEATILGVAVAVAVADAEG